MASRPQLVPDGVIEACLYADDLDAAATFFTSVLSLELVAREAGRHVFFRCGSTMLLVFNPHHTSTQQTDVDGALIPLHGTEGSGHVALRIAPGDLASWRSRLAEAGVAVESEVAWPQGGHSIYFRDPAGNSIELVTPQLWRIP